MKKHPSRMRVAEQKAEDHCSYLIPENYSACFDIFAMNVDIKECEKVSKIY